MKAIEAIKDLAAEASCNFHSFSRDRCIACPAYWEQVDHWGEYDAGCRLHRDHLEFCPLSLLPKFVMKPYLKLEERREERRWEKAEKEMFKKWEEEHGQPNNGT